MSSEIIEIDERFVIRQTKKMIFLSVREEHFSISGVILDQNKHLFSRIDGNIQQFSAGIKKRVHHTAGGQIRFKTTSRHLAMNLVIKNLESMPWQSRCGAVGVDFYIGTGKEKKWFYTEVASSFRKRIMTVLELPELPTENSDDMKEITIYLPLYSEVQNIELGFDKNSRIDFAVAFHITLPIVFYGSSITQGCAAGRPGTSFPSLVARAYDANYINFGFSSSAHGELSVAKKIAELDMCALVMEYDHNADTAEELKSTHFDFYKTVRKKHPFIPILVLSRCSGGLSISKEDTEERRRIILDTVKRGVELSDEQLFFIDGSEIIPWRIRQNCFVDGKHPNDYGMNLIADAIIEKFSSIGFGERENE